MINTILCLIDFYKSKKYSSKGAKLLTIFLEIILNIIMSLSFEILMIRIKEDNIIIAGYFVMISIFYFLIIVREKISIMKYMRELFVLPISSRELFFSMFGYTFFSCENLLYLHLYVIPIYFLSKSFLDFIILFFISILILITIDIITTILCQCLISMLYSKLLTLICIFVVGAILYIGYFYYKQIIKQFAMMYINNPFTLIFILLILIPILCKTSHFLFSFYEYALKNNN